MQRLATYLYKMQLCQYRTKDYFALCKKPTQGQAKLTPRLKRLRFATVLLCVVGVGSPCFWLAGTVALAQWILWPVEKLIQQHFVKKAVRTLRRRTDLIKIGVTGSYGKTSVKNILAELLATRYRVVASPASFNTPQGFARTVNEHLRPDTQIIIMEMGARRRGEIREMCRLFQPQHGIITGIGACHLATFGDVATVAQTKAELFAALPADGVAVSDGDNPWCQKLQHPRLRLVHSATTPTLVTNLLGTHQQKNLQMAAAVAQALGIDAATIAQTAQHLTPIPHRLEKIIAPNGIIILDDSYNANPASAANALQVLSTATGRKVVQTPGFVEQGTNTAEAHQALCAQIKAVADGVIAVGTLNRPWFVDGLQDWDGQVAYVATREDAKQYYPRWLSRGDTLLILNDLPENY